MGVGCGLAGWGGAGGGGGSSGDGFKLIWVDLQRNSSICLIIIQHHIK